MHVGLTIEHTVSLRGLESGALVGVTDGNSKASLNPWLMTAAQFFLSFLSTTDFSVQISVPT